MGQFAIRMSGGWGRANGEPPDVTLWGLRYATTPVTQSLSAKNCKLTHYWYLYPSWRAGFKDECLAENSLHRKTVFAGA
jgi:hypothetical protein